MCIWDKMAVLKGLLNQKGLGMVDAVFLVTLITYSFGVIQMPSRTLLLVRSMHKIDGEKMSRKQ